MSKHEQTPKIVIVGAGFGGIAVVNALKHAPADVTIIDRTNHYVFQPLLYQVATAALSPADIATAIRSLVRNHSRVSVVMGDVIGVNADQKTVTTADGSKLIYDYLVMATGAAYSFFGQDDWAVHVGTLKTIDDAIAIRTRLLSAFEKAEQAASAEEVQRLLTFVVVGAGPTGVEMAGTTAELARSTLARDFRNIDPTRARVILCDRSKRVLPAFPEKISAYAAASLKRLGVDILLGQSVEVIDSTGLTLGGDRIESPNIFWCAGTEAQPAAKWLNAGAARNGGVKVLEDCSVPGRPDIFAIGDVANYEVVLERPLPGLAAVAKQQGTYVGTLLAARVSKRAEPKAFHYRDLGMMAVIGRSRAVAQLGKLSLTGVLAWVAWSLVHLMLLVNFRSRLMVYMNWTWAWFTYGRGARLLTNRAMAAMRARDAPIRGD